MSFPSSLTFSIFFAVISFEYTEQQRFLFSCLSFYLQWCDTQFILSFWPSSHSFGFLSFSPPLPVPLLLFQILSNEPLRHQLERVESFVVLLDNVASKARFFWASDETFLRLGWNSSSSSLEKRHGENGGQNFVEEVCTEGIWVFSQRDWRSASSELSKLAWLLEHLPPFIPLRWGLGGLDSSSFTFYVNEKFPSTCSAVSCSRSWCRTIILRWKWVSRLIYTCREGSRHRTIFMQ